MQDVILREIPRRSRTQPWSRRVAPTRCDDGMGCKTEEVVEKKLGKGDVFTGTLSFGVPHGVGKYIWADGCMYEGEWRNGKANGEGRFSWPSGATYEGCFRQGKMDGQGTFIGVEGDSFQGQWMADRKHGYGKKRYANGDVYCGRWTNNFQDGEGVYRWNDGNEFIGGWRKGVIHGKGTLILTNGDRFHGVWDNGSPLGKGFFSDSRRSSVDGGAPKICIWELDGEAGDITCDIIDTVDTSSAANTSADREEETGSSFGKSPGTKRPGRVVSQGDKNYELIMSLQVGIRHSVGKQSSSMQELRQSDFDPSEKFWTRFPPEGSKNTPPHSFPEFKWKDYCPAVFRHLRELFAIDAADYLLAICGSDALMEFSSPGKSGSFFYLTLDDRFMIKTIKKSEVKVLSRMLPSYYQHVCRYNNTLITKFYGLHCIRPSGCSKMRFIVMGNLFDSEYPIHKRFDLKGSSYGRSTYKNGDETVTLKDLDFNLVFHLEHSWHQELIRQVGRDCEFLETEGIMDYSLLLGVHFRDGDLGGEAKTSPNTWQNEEMGMRGYHLLPNMDWVMESRAPQIRLGVNMAARGECAWRRGYGKGEVDDVVLYFGIIDILQDYDISKKLEHAYKSLQVDPVSISAVDPKLYSKRFRHFISKIFLREK